MTSFSLLLLLTLIFLNCFRSSAFNGLQFSLRTSRNAASNKINRVAVWSTPTTEVVKSEGDLDVGDFEDVEFIKVGSGAVPRIGEYQIKATIPSKQMNSFLDEYKEEMRKRKVVFPGFRAGKLPPYVMGDVRRYLVCFGLETMIGALCNYNSLKCCDENGGDVLFGDDSYYKQIIKEDFRGFDYEKQRDSWREGTDFSFVARFFAEKEGNTATTPATVDTDEVK